MRKVIFMLPLMFALLWSASVGAQQKPRLRLVVENPGGEIAKQCGITKSTIESLSALTLRNNGILVSPDKFGPEPYLYVATTVATGCTFMINVSVRAITAPPLAGAFKARPGTGGAVLVFCEKAAIDVSAAPFVQNLEALIKLCLGDLEY